MSHMETPENTPSGDASPSQGRHEHHHHHHHHHHHLDRITGKGAEATGKRVVIGVDSNEHSLYACEWFFEHLWGPEDYVVLLNCPDLHDVVKSQWGAATEGMEVEVNEEEAQQAIEAIDAGKAYVFDREAVDHKLKEGEEKVHQELEKYKEKLLAHGAHGKVRAVSAKNPGDAILKTAEEEEVDIIVIGCRGRGSIRRFVLGTVSDYIVHHAAVPVVVCRYKTSTRRRSSAINPPNPDELHVSHTNRRRSSALVPPNIEELETGAN